MINHQNNFATNLTGAVSAGATTSPLNDIPTIDAPFYLAFDATNINGNYEVVKITSKTSTNVNHAALANNHTTAEEVRCVCPATEMDAWSAYLSRNTQIEIQILDVGASWSTGDGKAYFYVPSAINGYNLTSVWINNFAPGTTGVNTITLMNYMAAGGSQDMLSTGISIDSGEYNSTTAATPYVIDLSKDNVSTYDAIGINIDSVCTTPPKGLWMILEFTKP